MPRALAVGIDMGFQRLDDPDNEHPLLVRGNLVLVREVIGNLIDNALKYVPTSAPKARCVTVTVTRLSTKPAGRWAKSWWKTTVPACRMNSSRIYSSASFAAMATAWKAAPDSVSRSSTTSWCLHNGSVHYEDAPAPEGGARFIVRMPLKTA